MGMLGQQGAPAAYSASSVELTGLCRAPILGAPQSELQERSEGRGAGERRSVFPFGSPAPDSTLNWSSAWARGRWEVGTRAGGPPADSIGRLLGTKVEGQTTEVFSGFLRRGTQTAGGIPGTQVVGDPRFWRAEMGLFL